MANQMRTRIKMCGMTRSEDIRFACEQGVDAIGMVFYPPSSRSVTIEQASELSKAVLPFVSKTVLFVNADAGFIKEVVSATHADVIQFHGDETDAFCQQFNMRYIKALRVQSSEQIRQQLAEHKHADAILLDAYVEGMPGGTGNQFDWAMIPDELKSKIILAGGLSPDNVFKAVREIRPYGVDVSGGIESSKGIKSEQKIRLFSDQVRRADLTLSEISS